MAREIETKLAFMWRWLGSNLTNVQWARRDDDWRAAKYVVRRGRWTGSNCIQTAKLRFFSQNITFKL